MIIGPETYVKEQAPAAYARRLAEQGFAALTFDPRHRGESGGEPRDLEDPLAKIADIRSAVDFMSDLDGVDPQRLFAVAVCQGSSEMVRAAVIDDRIRGLATLAGHYRDRQGDIEWFKGEEGLTLRLDNARRAEKAFQENGKVDYVPAVDKTNSAAGMPGELVWSWYQNWIDESLPWSNRFAVMSDARLLPYESMTASSQLENRTSCSTPINACCPTPRNGISSACPRRTSNWCGGTASCISSSMMTRASLLQRSAPLPNSSDASDEASIPAEAV